MCMPVFVSLTHGAENQNIFCKGYTSSILITLNSIDYIQVSRFYNTFALSLKTSIFVSLFTPSINLYNPCKLLLILLLFIEL